MTETNTTESPGRLMPIADKAPVDAIASPGDGLSRRLKVAGIVATAAVVGFVGVLTAQGSSAAPGAGNGPGRVVGPGGFGGQGGPQGGFADRGLQGTVDAVSSSSITVAGTTIQVTSATQVVVGGAQGSLADVTKGATVFVRTVGTGGSRSAERIFVGSMGPGGPPPGQQPPPPGTGTPTAPDRT